MTISLDPHGDGFVLRRTAESDETKIVLSEEDVLLLSQSALAYRQDIMSRRHEGAVFATPVSQVNALWDALGENILVEMRFQPRGNIIFEVSPECSTSLVEKLRNLLADRPASELTRQ